MTDNDIIKGLECHLGKNPHRCMECPYSTPKCDCLKHLHLNSLDLINRLKEENLRLQNKVELLEQAKKMSKEDSDKSMESAMEIIRKQEAEIERLQSTIKSLVKELEDNCDDYD